LMRRLWAALFLLALLGGGGAIVGSCGDDRGPANADAGNQVDAAMTTDAQTGPPDSTASNALMGCLERAGELPRPPSGHLACDLIPPGLSL
jgi:hypothetical protein